MQSRRVFLRVGVAVGTLLTFSAGLGILGMFLGMGRAARVLGKNGISDPHGLSTTVAGTMLAGAFSVVLLPAGIVLLIVCLVLLRRRGESGPPPLPRFVEKIESPPDLY